MGSVSGTVASDFRLIIDTDSDFSTGATVVSASSYVGGIVTFTGVNLNDGQFFTLGTEVNQPPVANIGGQQKQYLMKQLNAYRAGEREHAQMTIIARMLSDEDVDNVSEWYSHIIASFEIPQ